MIVRGLTLILLFTKKSFENKIKKLLNVKNVKKSENRGDFSFGTKYGEIKITFLSQVNCYNITHIRLYQDFDFYLFCFIDCE